MLRWVWIELLLIMDNTMLNRCTAGDLLLIEGLGLWCLSSALIKIGQSKFVPSRHQGNNDNGRYNVDYVA